MVVEALWLSGQGLNFKGFYTKFAVRFSEEAQFLADYSMHAFWRFQRALCGAVRCSRVLWRKHVYRECRTCIIVYQSKCYGESCIVESLFVKLFFMLAYAACIVLQTKVPWTTTLELLAPPQCISFHRRHFSLHLHHHGQLHILHRHHRPLHRYRAPYTGHSRILIFLFLLIVL